MTFSSRLKVLGGCNSQGMCDVKICDMGLQLQQCRELGLAQGRSPQKTFKFRIIWVGSWTYIGVD